MSGHILKTYDEDLSTLKDDVLQMGRLALTNLEKALKGLWSGDRDLCSDVIEDDEEIDSLEKKIDEQGMSILLRFNPVASDLRLVLSSINICRSLERIGDHAVTIAKRSRKILKLGTVDEVRLLEPLYQEAEKTVSAVITAYSDVDQNAAMKIVDLDRGVDQLSKKLSKNLSQQIADGTDQPQALLNIIFIARSLGRIGDLSVNVAEDVVFITSAEDIRHQ